MPKQWCLTPSPFRSVGILGMLPGHIGAHSLDALPRNWCWGPRHRSQLVERPACSQARLVRLASTTYTIAVEHGLISSGSLLWFTSVAAARFSLEIYHITLDEVNRAREELKLPELPTK